jgi:uncharacterized Ntn-hydrolase superfamily protein
VARMERHRMRSIFLLCLTILSLTPMLSAQDAHPGHPIATFSIVGRDSVTGELGIAVASRFFAVGSVVPWAAADAGAVATQSFANTSFGWRGLDAMRQGGSPHETVDRLLKDDADSSKRQIGMVDTQGRSATFTGSACISWAGGRVGRNYACQGNILTGENVIDAVERTFLNTKGTLADRLYAALCAGDARGGDSRGRQSAAILVVKDRAGYGGFTDRAIDIRVDDHQEPFRELGRLLRIGQMNYAWNEAWTLFTKRLSSQALPLMERAVEYGRDNAEAWYDLAVIRLAAGGGRTALDALEQAVTLNPKLKRQAELDADLTAVRDHPRFKLLVK